MCFFNSVKRKISLSREAQAYLKKIPHHTKKVLKEAKKRYNDRYTENVTNKTKNIWQSLIKQVGKCSSFYKKTELKTETGIGTNLQKVAEM